MHRLHRRTLVLAVGLCLAVGVLGGVAAADHAGDSEVDSNTSVTVNDYGGYFHTHCTGSPTTHECDKDGELNGEGFAIDYEGFNNDSFEGRYSRFGDTFVFTVDGEEHTFSFTCEFTDEPPSENPCPVDPPGNSSDDGGDASSERRGDQRSNNRSPDHALGP